MASLLAAGGWEGMVISQKDLDLLLSQSATTAKVKEAYQQSLIDMGFIEEVKPGRNVKVSVSGFRVVSFNPSENRLKQIVNSSRNAKRQSADFLKNEKKEPVENIPAEGAPEKQNSPENENSEDADFLKNEKNQAPENPADKNKEQESEARILNQPKTREELPKPQDESLLKEAKEQIKKEMQTETPTFEFTNGPRAPAAPPEAAQKKENTIVQKPTDLPKQNGIDLNFKNIIIDEFADMPDNKKALQEIKTIKKTSDNIFGQISSAIDEKMNEEIADEKEAETEKETKLSEASQEAASQIEGFSRAPVERADNTEAEELEAKMDEIEKYRNKI
jgi:hypothetical protein